MKYLLSLLMLLLSISLFAAPQKADRKYGGWTSSAINGGGYLQHVIFTNNPEVVYMTSDVGGLFRSADSGKSWKMLLGNFPPDDGAQGSRGLIVDVKDENHIWLATGGTWSKIRGVYESYDGGQTWKESLNAYIDGNGPARNAGTILVANPKNQNVMLLGSIIEGVYRTEDAGKTWTNYGPDGVYPIDIKIDWSNENRVWLICGGLKNYSYKGKKPVMTKGMYLSEDGGKTWVKQTDESPAEIVQDPKIADTLYGVYDKEQIQKSTDNGKTWVKFSDGITPYPAGANMNSDGRFRAITTGPDFILAGSCGGTMYKLKSGESKWQRIPVTKVIYDGWFGNQGAIGSELGFVGVDPRDPKHWVQTDFFSMYQTYDEGATWTFSTEGAEMLVSHTLAQDVTNRNVVHAGAADCGYFRTVNGGDSFIWGTNKEITNNVKFISPSKAYPGRLYAVSTSGWDWFANQVFISDNGGVNWRKGKNRGLPDMSIARCNTIIADPVRPDTAYLTVSGKVEKNNGGVYKTVDAGKSWAWISHGMPAVDKYFRTEIWAHGPELAASINGSLMAISWDTGKINRYDTTEKKWIDVKINAAGVPNSVVADPIFPGRYYVAMREGGLFVSEDDGQTWRQIVKEGVWQIGVDLLVAGRLAAVTKEDILYSTDFGKNWMVLDKSLPCRRPNNKVCFNGDKLYVGAGGNGYFYITLPSNEPYTVYGPVMELVVNGDMSKGETKPDNWVKNGNKDDVTLSKDTEIFTSAPSSMKITAAPDSTNFIQQQIIKAPVGPVNIEASIKVTGKFSELQLVCQSFSANWGKQLEWNYITIPQTTDEWQKIKKTIELPAETKIFSYGIYYKGGGTIWMDDFKASAPLEVTVVNLGFKKLSNEYSATDNRIKYTGRFDHTDTAASRCAWSASAITFKFNGTAANAKLKTDGKDYVEIIVDGESTNPIELKNTAEWYALASNLPAKEHTISIVKRTEATQGNLYFYGIQADSAELITVPAASKKIEVIGDSISAGYGNEADNERAHFAPDTQNAWMTYGAIAARKLNADFVCIAGSGRQMWPSYTIPDIYDYTLPNAKIAWDMAKYHPDLVLINLGTNDFNKIVPEEEGWVKKYRDFIGKIRAAHPNVFIYCAIGPMLTDSYSAEKRGLTTVKKYLNRIVTEEQNAGNNKIKFLEFPPQTWENGFGADYHPSIKTHNRMADQLTAAIKADLKWE